MSIWLILNPSIWIPAEVARHCYLWRHVPEMFGFTQVGEGRIGRQSFPSSESGKMINVAATRLDVERAGSPWEFQSSHLESKNSQIHQFPIVSLGSPRLFSTKSRQNNNQQFWKAINMDKRMKQKSVKASRYWLWLKQKIDESRVLKLSFKRRHWRHFFLVTHPPSTQVNWF